jgi:hypothetical protein
LTKNKKNNKIKWLEIIEEMNFNKPEPEMEELKKAWECLK